MYNNQNSELADKPVYSNNAVPPKGRWIDYVHVIQPPTFLSQGLGRVYLKGGTYKDIPIAAFVTLTQDISASFDSIPINAVEGQEVNIAVNVNSSFNKDITTNYEWTVTRKNSGKALTTNDGLKFSGDAGARKGQIKLTKTANKKTLYVSFRMPNEAVRIQFKVNDKGEQPKENELSNNKLDSYVKFVTPKPLPYDVLSMRIKYPLPPNTATLFLPNENGAAWNGNATGALNVYNGAPDLYRNYEVTNNPPVNEPKEKITRKAVPKYTIKREDFGDLPLNNGWLNPLDPRKPIVRDGYIKYSGTVKRPYKYKEQVCRTNAKGEEKCHYVDRPGVQSADFSENIVKQAYEMYSYNGMETVPPLPYKNTINPTAGGKAGDKWWKWNLLWTNESYEYSVLRWMHHLDENGKPFNYTEVPGQYKRTFIQQASGSVQWQQGDTQAEEYGPSRQAAKQQSTKKDVYDKAVFATDRQLQKYAYPIKSGYYFNPTGTYRVKITTVTYKPTKDDTKDHKDLVKAVINSFKYQSDLIYINAKKKPVNISNVELNKQGVGFKKVMGEITAKKPKGVNAIKMLEVRDRSFDEKRYTKKVEEIQHSQLSDGDTHKYWKMVLEGYDESNTIYSHNAYKYREYVRDQDEKGKEQHIYKITETTDVSFIINPKGLPLYTHANMQNGNYTIKVSIDPTKLPSQYAYHVLKQLNGISVMDSIPVTVVGSIFDDLNN
ncbi:hypothetical protein [Paenibacillus sp. CAA11]|uniref:hypothetical protein n=1 Tax=Paenibacillus sp. CAA11 TaxID=1532905 RepID=UPI00131F32D1|nr:hypothetical protein [Paenibacillus sp. CAA11]